MYLEYWGFQKKPFQNTPDPYFFYESMEHEEVLAKLLYTVEESLGAAMLTGVFGCGKTLIGQALFNRLSTDRYKVAFITNPQLEYVELLRAIVRNLKKVELPSKKTELSADYLLEILGNILENNMRDAKDTVVIIDEAHIIKDERIFEELRLLLNFQRKDKFLLTLLLFGQPELREKIEDNKQLEQRIAIKCHLEAFGYKDMHNYISHRLYLAGTEKTKEVFDESAFKEVHSHSGGIPRRVNRVCDLSLLVGMHKNAKIVDDKIVKEAIRSLGG